MIALTDFQFSLVPDITSEAEIAFGAGQHVEVDKDGFNPGGPEWSTQDGVNPINGVTRFGIDTLNSTTWALDMFVNAQDDPEALTFLAELQKAWLYGPASGANGKVAAVRYCLAGRTRWVYGRPRQFAAKFSNQFLNGYIPITANFKTADSLSYDDLLQETTLQFVEGSEGGFILPIILPAVSDPPGEAEVDIFVGGDHKAYPIIRFNGPVVNPSLTWADGSASLSISANIPADDWIEVDTRPWQQSVTKKSGASVPGSLGRRQYLEDMTLAPNQHTQFSFRGTSSTGTATCSISWRDTHTTL